MSPSNFSSSISSADPSIDVCFRSRNVLVFLGYSATNLLLLPLYVLVLCVGHQRRLASHSDFFTYNMVAMELISTAGVLMSCCGGIADVQALVIAGLYMFSIASPGQMMLHILTCVERYVAVIHPVKYRHLKQSAGVRIRNMIIGCVWLICLLCLALTEDMVIHFSSAAAISFLISSFTAVFFCSLSVLCVLIRPGPGERVGERDQLKQRAVSTIMAILGALLLRFMGIFVCTVMYSLSTLQEEKCLLIMSSLWLSMPSSLVLPLLFLQRTGKLQSCSCLQ